MIHFKLALYTSYMWIVEIKAEKACLYCTDIVLSFIEQCPVHMWYTQV